ncbi:MAG: sigma-70 family RNA polymerase sigma factor [Ruminococcaceae bacterium]|nr:sigma-70 family RNA polymerase sigma factor [Oscillospiraceae bacterium]
MQDKKLASELEKRNEAAMSRLIDQYAKLLWSVAGAVLHGVGTAQDVEECVADVFIYLWEDSRRYDPQRGTLKSWLAMVARSKAIDRWRELSARSTVPWDEVFLAGETGTVDSVMEEETRRALIAAVNALGEPDREILVRRYYYGQKPKEIALALNMSVKQVDNRLYQTKRRLRQVLCE